MYKYEITHTMKKLLTLLAMAFALYACQMPQITDENIESAIQSGQFAQAEQMIKLKIATEELTPGQIWDLEAKVQTMHRINTTTAAAKMYGLFLTVHNFLNMDRSFVLMTNITKHSTKSPKKNL